MGGEPEAVLCVRSRAYCDILCADPENTEGADLQRKLELLNSIMDQEARAEQARRQLQYYGHCEYTVSRK
jgi:hypothetical protein